MGCQGICDFFLIAILDRLRVYNEDFIFKKSIGYFHLEKKNR